MQNKKITLGNVDNVYSRQTIVLQPYEIRQVDGVHTFFRVYSTSGNIEVAAQNSGIFSEIKAGTWIKNPMDDEGNIIELPYIRLKNTTNSTVTVELAFSNGEVGDDSLILENTESNPVFTENLRGTSYNLIKQTIAANDSYSFTPQAADIEYLIQNKDNSNSVYLFDAAGLELPAGADFKTNIQAPFSIYNNNPSAVDIIILEVLK